MRDFTSQRLALKQSPPISNNAAAFIHNGGGRGGRLNIDNGKFSWRWRR
jgi:hypothetical protein